MHAPAKYLLFTEALRHASGRFLWRFLLLKADSDQTVTASDLVDEASATRTELLALVRGLEALDEPGEIRLFTASKYISRGMSRGLSQWRAEGWHWERFGRRVPVRDCDLWRRVDHALEFHTVQCRAWGEPDHTVDQQAYLPMPEQDAAATARRRRPMRQRVRVAAATRNTLGGLRRQVETLLEPALLPAS